MKNILRKNNKGITLISLVVMIIIILILATVGTNTGINVIRESKYHRAVSEMKTMQTKINEMYAEYKGGDESIVTLGSDIDDVPSSLKSKAETAIRSVDGNLNHEYDYKYYSSDDIKNTLDLDGVEGDYLVNIKNRNVILIEGTKSDGKTYYSLSQIETEQFNVEYINPSISLSKNGGTFYYSDKEPLDIRVTLNLIDEPYDTNLKLEYKWSNDKDNEPTEDWEEYTTEIKADKEDFLEDGTYYLWTKISNLDNGKELNVDVSKAFIVKEIVNDKVEYTVKYKLANLEGNDYITKETIKLNGKKGSQVTPEVKTYTGFKSPAAQTVTIEDDTEVTYEYERNKYNYTLNLSNEITISNSTPSGQYYYEQPITLKATANEGYIFVRWKIDDETLTTQAEYTFNMPARDITVMAETSKDELTFNNNTVNTTYSTNAQTIENAIDEAENGTGSYTYSITEGNGNNYFSINGRNIGIAANVPAGTYEITIRATDSNSGAIKDATYTIIINSVTMEAPVVTVNTEGVITWENVLGATGYEISYDNGAHWKSATSGEETINTDTAGEKTVKVRPVDSTGNYTSPGPAGTATATVYSLTLNKGIGIISVTGAGNYVSGKQVSIDAEVSTGYTWSTWEITSGSTPANANNKNTTVTVGKNTELTATATIHTSKLTVDPAEGTVNIKSPSSAQAEQITESKTYTQTYNTELEYEIPTKADTTDTSTNYTVTYNTDGGSTAPSAQNATITIVTGYAFNGWTKSAGFKGTLNETNKTYTFPADNNNTDTITATFTSSEKSRTVAQVTLGAAPTKEGYTFAGWKSSTNNEVYEAGASYTPTENTTMTAEWEVNALTFADKTITKTFSTTAQTENNAVNVASNGTGTYTYAITGGNTNNYFSLSGRNLSIATNTPANTSGYEITITATDSGSGATKTATYTIKINKKQSTTSVTITGTNTYGQKLTAENETDGDGAISYQWYHTSVSDSNKITDATSKDYTIGTELVGKKIYVKVTVADGTNYLGSNNNDVTDSINNATETVSKANGSGSVSMDGWTYGQTANDPVPESTTNGTENVSYKYKVSTAGDSTYTSTKPSEVGTYTVQATFSATANYNAVTATANFTIAKADMSIPTVTIDTDGKVTWTQVAGATSYQIKFDNGNWDNATTEDATSGSILINTTTTGTKTVAVRAVSTNSNYNTPSGEGTASKEVFSLTLNKGAGISSVTGAGNYVSGKQVSIDAEVSAGYTWSKWNKTSGTAPANANNKSTTVTIGANTVLEAQATASALIFTEKTITKTFSTSAQTENNAVNVASNGTGTYTYAITGGNTNNYFSLSGRNLSIAANTPANTSGYEITITATDSGSGATKAATYTIKINKKQSTTSVTITGTNTVGQTLTADKTTDGDGTVSYQWYHTSISDSNKITNATNATFVPTSDLVGKKIYVVVAVANGTNYLGSDNNDVTDATENGTENVKANGYTVEYYQGATKINTSTLTPGATTNNNLAAYNGTAPTGGWEFAGWSANNGTTATTVTYTDEQNITTDIVAEGQTAKLYAIFTRDIVVTYYITADTSSTNTDAPKTQYYNPNGSPTSVSVTLPDVTDGKKEHVFDGWDDSSSTKVGEAGDVISVTENTELTSRWKYIDIDTVKITATKYGSGQLKLDNIPDGVTVRVWTPTRFLPDKQRNQLYCQRNEPNLVLDSTHNTTESYISKGTMPDTYTDVYMDIQDKNGNVIYSVKYCNLTSTTSGPFVEDDYQGEIYISAVSFKERSSGTVVRKANHANANPVPTLNNGVIDFDLSFKLPTSSSQFYARYNVTIINDTSQDYTFQNPGYTPHVWCNGNSKEASSDCVPWNITGINPGDEIFSGQEITVVMNYTFIDPVSDNKNAHRNGWTYDVDRTDKTNNGINIIENTEETSNSRLTAIVNETTEDLTGDNTRAEYTIEVTNGFDIEKTFELSINETTKFVIVDESGNKPTYTIAARPSDDEETVRTYKFYLQKAEGAEYSSSSQKATIMFKPTDSDNAVPAGKVYANVDVSSTVQDSEPPMISNVKITEVAEENTSSPIRRVKVSWTGTDDSIVPIYYVVLHKPDGTDQTYETDTPDADSLYIDGLTEDATYSVTVYGKDSEGNMPGTDTINSATTTGNYACKSANTKVEWEFEVSISKAGCSSNPSATTQTAYRGYDYKITFTKSNSSYSWKTTTVSVGGNSITPSYSDSDSNRILTVPKANVTGKITINVTAGSNGCLVEGTQILLADGTYKNVEEINYTDLLEVYDHVNGRMTKVYPIWIEQQGTSDYYEKLTFSDGTELKVVGEHCLYSVDFKRYINVADESECSVGTRVYKVNNDKLEEVTITNIEYINEEVKYYNVVSAIQYNIIANGLLTTDPTSSISNVYGFKENAIYSENYKVLSTQNQLAYEDCNFVPYYLYKGLNLKNIASLIGKELDVSFLSDFVNRRTLDLISKDGKAQFMMTTSLDDLESVDKEKYLYEEGSTYKLPETGADYFIETSTGTKYKPGDTVTVDYSMHFEALSKSDNSQNHIWLLIHKLLDIIK